MQKPLQLVAVVSRKQGFLLFQNHLVMSLLNSNTAVSAIFGSRNDPDELLRSWNNHFVCIVEMTSQHVHVVAKT